MIYFRFTFLRLFRNFAICYFTLILSYFLIDLFSHASIPSFRVVSWNFVAMILLRSDLLISLSFLLSSLATFLSLNEHRELMSCQAAGFSKKRLLTPFYIFALFLTSLSFCNCEWGTPLASTKLRTVTKSRKIAKAAPFSIKILPDKSRILFQTDEEGIFDLYWIQSHDRIVHCKRLAFEGENPIGLFVDHFQKTSDNLLEKVSSIERYPLDLSFKEMKNQPFINRYSSLSRLHKLLTTNVLSISSDRGRVLTFLLYKLLYPLFPLLFLTIISPSFTTYRKSLNPYFFFLGAVFFYLLFHSFIKTFILLGENYILSPWFTLVVPFIILQGFFSFRLYRCET